MPEGDTRLGVQIAASMVGGAQVQSQVALLTAQLNAMRDAIENFNRSNLAGAAGSGTVLESLRRQASGLEEQIKRITAGYVAQYQTLDEFNIRAIAAMRGQSEAIKGTARALDERDALMRAGSHTVAYNLLDPVAFQTAAAPAAGAARRAIEQELTQVFAGQTGGSAEQIARARIAMMRLGESGETAGKSAKGLASGLNEVSEGSRIAAKEAGHATAIFDGFARGQYRQVIASIGSAMRDAGLGVTGLITGVGILIGVMAIERFGRMIATAAELAEKTQNAAAAAGMGTEEYSRLSNIMQMATGESKTLERAMEILGDRTQRAISDPFSRERSGFATLGFSPEQLAEGLRSPISMLELLREKYLQLGPASAEAFRMALGRQGFQELVPLLRATNEEFARWSEAATRAGTTTDEMADKLKPTVEATRELSEAFEHLEQAIARLAGSSGIIGTLASEIEELRKAAEGWSQWFERGTWGQMGSAAAAQVLNFVSPGLGSSFMDLSILNQKTARETAQLHGTPGLVPGGALGPSGAGLQPGFQSELSHMFAAAAADGINLGIGSGLRTAQHQAEIYAHARPGMAARPGHSMHELGLAADLTSGGRMIQAGTPASEWLQQHAAEYGLAVSPWRGHFEPWHVEPAGARLGAPLPTPAMPQAAIPSASAGIDLAKERSDLQRYVQEQQDSISRIRADANKRVADAGHDTDAIISIRRREAEQIEQVESQIAQRTQEAAKRAHQADVPEAEQQFRERANRAAVAETEAQTSIVQAQNRARDEQYRRQEESARTQISQAKQAEEAILDSTTASAAEKIAAVENYRNTVSGIYSQLETQTLAIYKQDSSEFQRIQTEKVNAARQADRQITEEHKKQIQEQLRDARRSAQEVGAMRSLRGAQAEAAVTVAEAGGASRQEIAQLKVAAAIDDATKAQEQYRKEVDAINEVLKTAAKGSEAEREAKIKLIEAQAKLTQEETQDFNKAYQAWKTTQEGMNSFFSSLGSGVKSATNDIIKALISPDVTLIHAGLTTIRETHQGQQIRQAIGNMLLHGIQSAVDSVESAVGKMFTNMLAKAVGSDASAGIGGVFSKLLGIGGQAPQAAQFGLSAANLQAFNAALVQSTALLSGHSAATATGTSVETTRTGVAATNTITTTGNTLATSANTLATSANSTAQSAAAAGGGIGGFLKAIPLIGSLFMQSGGIVPSAQGGMVVGGIGGMLALLHPREMVLPARISDTIQSMTQGYGASPAFAGTGPTLNYSPSIGGGGRMSRSELSGMLNAHAGDMFAQAKSLFRSGSRF